MSAIPARRDDSLAIWDRVPAAGRERVIALAWRRHLVFDFRRLRAAFVPAASVEKSYWGRGLCCPLGAAFEHLPFLPAPHQVEAELAEDMGNAAVFLACANLSDASKDEMSDRLWQEYAAIWDEARAFMDAWDQGRLSPAALVAHLVALRAGPRREGVYLVAIV